MEQRGVMDSSGMDSLWSLWYKTESFKTYIVEYLCASSPEWLVWNVSTDLKSIEYSAETARKFGSVTHVRILKQYTKSAIINFWNKHQEILTRDFGTMDRIKDHWAMEDYKRQVRAELDLSKFCYDQNYDRAILFRRFDGITHHYNFKGLMEKILEEGKEGGN